MIPILAAAGAIGLIGKAANGVLSQVKQITSSSHGSAKPVATESFAALLAALGVNK